jgi:lipoprotein-anchoring transpeptidase ErfK/SrfK
MSRLRCLLAVSLLLAFGLVSLPLIPSQPSILGDTSVNYTGNKRILVDLTSQHLYAYEGDAVVYDFLISSGTYNRTPTGTYNVWTKVVSQKMSGGSKENGDYYYLPRVPYIMFFSNNNVAKQKGFSIHGAYWHNKFGQPMSHGCINMRPSESAILYQWAPNGIPITIVGHYVPSHP